MSTGPDKTVLLVGASRGLGLGLAEGFLLGQWRVLATVRDIAGQKRLEAIADSKPGALEICRLDLTDPDAIDGFCASLSQRTFDVLFVNAGQYGPDEQSPAKTIQAEFSSLLWVNALAPVRIATQLQDYVRPQSGVVAFMSSIRASVAANQSAGGALYKASKAALNTMARTLFPDLRERGVSLRLFHPGWVRTDMGGPNATVSVSASVAGILKLIAEAQGAKDERFIDYEGRTLAW